MAIRKNKNIPEYKKGEKVNDLFVVRFKKPVRETSQGKYWFALKLQDAEGDTMLKYWGDKNKEEVQELYNTIQKDSIIQVKKGEVSEYKGKKQISVNKGQGTIKTVPRNKIKISDFIQTSEKDLDEMKDKLENLISLIQDPDLKKIVNAFFEDKEFKEKFVNSPAAMYHHHGWVHGLLEHTLTVTEIAVDVCKHHEELNKDLLITGGLLHDIGKIKEFETTTQIKVSDQGNLLGHIVMGVQMATKKMNGLNVPQELKDKVLHIIISHHNAREHGSPKTPSFPEALVIAKADEIDALTTEMIHLKETAETEDSFRYSKHYGNIYLK